MTLMKQNYSQETMSLTLYGCSIHNNFVGVVKVICENEDEGQHFSLEF
jgi:hypothetical protein